MKRRINIIFLSMIVMSIVFLSGCRYLGNGVEEVIKLIETPVADEVTEKAVECINSGDYIDMYNNFNISIEEDEFYSGMQQIESIIEGEIIDYKKTYINSSTNISNSDKVTITQCTYYLSTSDSNYNMFVTLQKAGENEAEVVGIYVSPCVEKVQGNIVVNNIFGIYNLICWAVIVFALIKCIKSKIKLKWLWIIGILAQSGIAISKFPQSFNFTFQIIKVGISNFTAYNNGGYILVFVAPVIAIIFLCMRKKLVENPDKNYNKTDINSDIEIEE